MRFLAAITSTLMIALLLFTQVCPWDCLQSFDMDTRPASTECHQMTAHGSDSGQESADECEDCEFNYHSLKPVPSGLELAPLPAAMEILGSDGQFIPSHSDFSVRGADPGPRPLLILRI